MADKDLTIAIKTTADTAGAKSASEAIDRVTDSAARAAKDSITPSPSAKQASIRAIQDSTDKVRVNQIAFYDLDAQLTKTGNTIEHVASTPLQKLSSVVPPATAGVKNMGMVATQVGYQVTDFAVQVQGGTSAVTAFTQQAPQAIGALQMLGGGASNLTSMLGSAVSMGTGVSLVLTELVIGGGMVYKAWESMKEAQDDLSQAGNRYMKQQQFIIQQQIDLGDKVRMDFILDYYQRQTAELVKQEAVLLRIKEIQGARASAAETQASTAVTVAQNTPGADVMGAKANALAVQLETKLENLGDAVAKAEEKVKNTQVDSEKANATLHELNTQGRQNSDEWVAAGIAVEKMENAATEAKLDLAAEREKFQAAKLAISSEIDGSLSTLKADVLTETTGAATKTRDAIQAKSDEMGGNITASAKTALEALNKILADGTVRPEELAQLGQAMAQAQAARESGDRQIAEAVKGVNDLLHSQANSVITALGLVTANLATQNSKINNLSTQLNNLYARQR